MLTLAETLVPCLSYFSPSTLNEHFSLSFRGYLSDLHTFVVFSDFSETFREIVNRMSEYFDVEVFATRLNFYPDSSSWKPFHHDSHAYAGKNRKVKEDFTMGKIEQNKNKNKQKPLWIVPHLLNNVSLLAVFASSSSFCFDRCFLWCDS